MATPNKVGGMQEAFLQLRWKSVSGMERAVSVIEKAGGQVLHAYPPALMVVRVPTNLVAKLVGKGGIVDATIEPFPDSILAAPPERKLGFAMKAWNDHFDLSRRTMMMAGPELEKAWDAPDRLPPDPPAEILALLRQREHVAGMGAALSVEGAPNMSIPVLVGRVSVGLIYVDSSVAEFQITDTEKSKVLSETIEGLNMLSGFEPRANIQWFYDIQRPKISLAANRFTNSNKNSWEDLWRDAAMQQLGYSGNIGGMNTYINQIKTANNAAWGYAIFVTKYPKDWFGYYWGNHVVMDFAVDGWGLDNFNLVVAHETGHVFGCPDEYSSSGCNCTQLGGRYQIPNGNCENCASPFVQCLMAHNSQAVCDYTRGHLGWNELAVQSKGATVLKGTWTFDFDTGVQGPPSGADIWWEQVDSVTRFLVPENGAMLTNLGHSNFDAVSLQRLAAQSYTATPINGSNNAANNLTAGTVIGIKTATGRYAKMAIDSYGYNLGIRWLTYT